MRHLILSVLVFSQILDAQSPAPAGFAAGSVEAQTRAEKVFLDTVTPASARRWLAALTEEPHVAGTPAEKKLADYVLARFKEFGLDAEIVRYDVFLNHPKHVSLRLVSPVEEELIISESPRSTSVSPAATACITPCTTTSGGWRNTAIRSFCITPPARGCGV